MHEPSLTLEEATRLLKSFAKTQTAIQLSLLDYKEHLHTLRFVLFALDHRAQGIFEEQLAVEHEKNQKSREELEGLLRLSDSSLGKPN